MRHGTTAGCSCKKKKHQKKKTSTPSRPQPPSEGSCTPCRFSLPPPTVPAGMGCRDPLLPPPTLGPAAYPPPPHPHPPVADAGLAQRAPDVGAEPRHDAASVEEVPTPEHRYRLAARVHVEANGALHPPAANTDEAALTVDAAGGCSRRRRAAARSTGSGDRRGQDHPILVSHRAIRLTVAAAATTAAATVGGAGGGALGGPRPLRPRRGQRVGVVPPRARPGTAVALLLEFPPRPPRHARRACCGRSLPPLPLLSQQRLNRDGNGTKATAEDPHAQTPDFLLCGATSPPTATNPPTASEEERPVTNEVIPLGGGRPSPCRPRGGRHLTCKGSVHQ